MYDIAMNFYDSDKFVQAYDYGYGISQDMANDKDGGVMKILYEGIADEKSENWVQTRDTYSGLVDEEIAVYNN